MKKNTIKTCAQQLSQDCDIYEIELIIAHVLKKDRVFIMTHADDIITKEQKSEIASMCKKRTLNIPLAYILGNKEFYGREFIVTKDTLVPRPETEILIENVLSFISNHNLTNVLIIDIGTGSGIIPITLSEELTKDNVLAKIIASDISNDALDVAKKNVLKHNIKNITFYNTDLLSSEELKKEILNTKDIQIIITANLPYVDTAIKESLLQNEESKSLLHEPSIALWSDDNGLRHYKKLIQQTILLNNSFTDAQKIISFYEISPEQLVLLKNYFDNTLSQPFTCFPDISGKNRVFQWPR